MRFYRGIAEELQKNTTGRILMRLTGDLRYIAHANKQHPDFWPVIHALSLRGILIQWPETAHYSLTESDTYVIELQKMEGI